MKKFILSVSAVTLMAIVSCSKDKACNCTAASGLDAASKTAYDNAVKYISSETLCNSANASLSSFKLGSCSWS